MKKLILIFVFLLFKTTIAQSDSLQLTDCSTAKWSLGFYTGTNFANKIKPYTKTYNEQGYSPTYYKYYDFSFQTKTWALSVIYKINNKHFLFNSLEMMYVKLSYTEQFSRTYWNNNVYTEVRKNQRTDNFYYQNILQYHYRFIDTYTWKFHVHGGLTVGITEPTEQKSYRMDSSIGAGVYYQAFKKTHLFIVPEFRINHWVKNPSQNETFPTRLLSVKTGIIFG